MLSGVALIILGVKLGFTSVKVLGILQCVFSGIVAIYDIVKDM